MTAIIALAIFGKASAQNDNAVVVPPAPPIVSAPLAAPMIPPAMVAPAPPPGLVPTPPPLTNSDSGSSAVSGTSPATASANAWVPKQTALIGVLNKVDGSIKDVSIPVGSQTAFNDLQVAVLACVVRPPDQVPDAAIFLAATPAGSQSGGPLYRGWVVRSIPGAAVAGNASYTLRVAGCE